MTDPAANDNRAARRPLRVPVRVVPLMQAAFAVHVGGRGHQEQVLALTRAAPRARGPRSPLAPRLIA